MKRHMSEDILIKYVLGEANAAEKQEISAWASASIENARKLEEVKMILESSRRLARVSPLGKAEAWGKFKQKRAAVEKEAGKGRIIRINVRWLSVAAALIILIGGGWLVLALYKGQRGSGAAGWVSVNAIGAVRIITLPDGSIVHLNKNSVLAYNKNFTSRRETTLTGEAFFDVRHNSGSPFNVHTNDINILDIGTAFNVRSRKFNTEVIVARGEVKVSRNSQAVHLKARQMVRVGTGDKELKVESTSDQLYDYYRTNMIKADNTPLWRLVEVLNEAYGVNIQIRNPALTYTPITITIQLKDPINNILELLKSTTPEMTVEHSARSIIIR
jgi:transmembrane sensor